jgi:MazG nucleotide pyrophosphohydrolase domain
VDIRSAQRAAWANKVAKGFSTTDVPLEFCLLSGEVAEAFDAWRTGRADLAEELADVAIYVLSLAEMVGADLEQAVAAKMAINEARACRHDPSGALVKDPPAPPGEPGSGGR